MKRVTFTLDDATIERLNELKEKFGISFSEAVRRAVWMYYQDPEIRGLGRKPQIGQSARTAP